MQGNSVPLGGANNNYPSALLCQACHHLHQFKDRGEKVQLMRQGEQLGGSSRFLSGASSKLSSPSSSGRQATITMHSANVIIY